MLLVPRSTECVEGISVNALGFAGGFLVKDESQLDRLKTWTNDRTSASGHVLGEFFHVSLLHFHEYLKPSM